MTQTKVTSAELQGNTLGYAQITSVFTATNGSLQDVTGLSLTVTTPVLSGNQRVEIMAFMSQTYSTVDADRMDWSIEQDGTVVQTIYNRTWSNGNGGNGGTTVIASVTPSAGSHTYKLRVARGLGTGVANVYATATTPSFITVRVL